MEVPVRLMLKSPLSHVQRPEGFDYETDRLIEARAPWFDIQLQTRERSRGVNFR